MNGLLQGQFCDSTVYKRPVIDVIKAPMVNTILLNLFSTILTLAITIPLGIYCAVHRRKASDSAIQAVTVVGYSLPSYLVGIVFIYLFAVKLKIFPVGGAKTPGSTYTGFAEFADFYISRLVVEHISRINAVDGNISARYFIKERIFRCFA